MDSQPPDVWRVSYNISTLPEGEHILDLPKIASFDSKENWYGKRQQPNRDEKCKLKATNGSSMNNEVALYVTRQAAAVLYRYQI